MFDNKFKNSYKLFFQQKQKKSKNANHTERMRWAKDLRTINMINMLMSGFRPLGWQC